MQLDQYVKNVAGCHKPATFLMYLLMVYLNPPDCLS